MKRPPRRFRSYVTVVVAAASVLLVRAADQEVSPNAVLLLVFIASALVSENLAVSLPNGGSTSISYPFFLAATLLMGPLPASLVAAASGVNLNDIRSKRNPWILVFNVFQLVLVVLVSFLVYKALGGTLLTRDAAAEVSVSRMAVPLASVVLLSSLLNDVLVTSGISLYNRIRFVQAWSSGAAWLLPMQLSLGAFGVALAYVTALAPSSFVLVVFPLVLARQVYQQYLELKTAYPASTRSLITALEAKDTYTRGHAERVAKYSTIIGRQVGLSGHQIEKLELAALLHDIGKIAIDREILRKPVPLTVSERDRIREHPTLGADILAKVGYLTDLVPMVRYHHEWIDGTGYGYGLRGLEIPIEARILAVADAYDAMTSSRAYRAACTHDEAVAEIIDAAGSQFDESIVACFASLSDVVLSSRDDMVDGSEKEGYSCAT